MRATLTRSLSALLLFSSLVVTTAVPASTDEDAASHRAFFERLSSLCGSSFEGSMSFPPDPNHAFAGKLLVANVEDCSEDEIRIPFAVGENRSRTWILTLGSNGLLLKHDHRHEDGTPDDITMYGGWALHGSAYSQSFAADEETKELIPETATNVWTISLDPDGSSLTYALERHSKPRFEATLRGRLD